MIQILPNPAKARPSSENGDGLHVDELRRTTIGEYHRMIKAGILTADDKVELLDGFLVRKMAQNDAHVVFAAIVNARVAMTMIVKLRCR